MKDPFEFVRKDTGALYDASTEYKRTCNKCYRARCQRERRANQWKGILKNKYGLDADTYEGMLQDQSGGCAICGKPPGKRRLAVDHCHRTGAVRGLLCHKCNMGIGFFDDTSGRLRAAAEYLERQRVIAHASEDALTGVGDEGGGQSVDAVVVLVAEPGEEQDLGDEAIEPGLVLKRETDAA